jgi:hypothetical protein
VLAGPWGDPVDGGLLLWHVHSADGMSFDSRAFHGHCNDFC